MTKEACEEFMYGDSGVMYLVADGHYAHALEVIINRGHLYPEIAKILYTLRISLAAHLNDLPQALQVMEEALSAGIYFPAAVFSQNAAPPGYANLFGNPNFERLKEVHQERYREAMDKALPVLNCMPPFPSVDNPPLLIAFHGNTSNIEIEADYYRHATRFGWLVAQPQSAQAWTAWGYVWGDMNVSEQQVRSYWTMIQEQNSFDRTRVVTAGISKGGEIAMWSVMSGIIPAYGFIALAPGGPFINNLENLYALVRPKKGSGVRGYLIVGDQDRWGYESTKQLVSVLRLEGFECELEICPGLGHWFPDDFEQKLDKALGFVTQT